MEFKVRKESQSVLERTFETYEKQGCVRGYQIASMLRSMRPDVPIDEQEFENVLFKYDPDKQRDKIMTTSHTNMSSQRRISLKQKQHPLKKRKIQSG